MGGRHTTLARIVEFAEQHKNDEGAVKAFARLELNRWSAVFRISMSSTPPRR
jgi:hypothetical protein